MIYLYCPIEVVKAECTPVLGVMYCCIFCRLWLCTIRQCCDCDLRLLCRWQARSCRHDKKEEWNNSHMSITVVALSLYWSLAIGLLQGVDLINDQTKRLVSLGIWTNLLPVCDTMFTVHTLQTLTAFVHFLRSVSINEFFPSM